MSLFERQRQRFQRQIKRLTDTRRRQFKRIKIIPLFVVGEKVMDDLTRELHLVIGISYKNGHCGDKKTNHYHCWGIWIDSSYLDGGRHPWELTKLKT